MALLLAGAACAPAPREPDLAGIIARTVAAQGGEEALAGVQSIFRQRNQRLFTLSRKPDLHLVVLLNDAGGVRYAEGFDGEVAWELVDDGPKKPQGERARIALWHTTQFPGPLVPLSALAGLGHGLTLLGRDTLDQTEYLRLRLTLSDGFERDYFVNARSHRIERAHDVRRLHAYEEAVQPIETRWTDFRQVDGIWVPFGSEEHNLETGEQLSRGTLAQVRLNVPVPSEVFSLDGSLDVFLAWLREAGLVPR